MENTNSGNGVLKIYTLKQFVVLTAFDSESNVVMTRTIDTTITNAVRKVLKLMKEINGCRAAPFKSIYNPISTKFNNNVILDRSVVTVLSAIYNNTYMTNEDNPRIMSKVIYNDKDVSDFAYYVNERTKERLVKKGVQMAEDNNIDLSTFADPAEAVLHVYKGELYKTYVEIGNIYVDDYDDELCIYGRLGANGVSDIPDSGITHIMAKDTDDNLVGYIYILYTGDTTCIDVDINTVDPQSRALTMDLAEEIFKDIGLEVRLETMIICQDKEKDLEYLRYIDKHVAKVKEVFDKHGEKLCAAVGADYNKTKLLIEDHDASKYSDEEFSGYRRHFYPTEGESATDVHVKQEFDKAWLHHIHCNGHHPEHWVLNDDGNRTVFDMPSEEIVVMICDWESFRNEDGSDGAYHYYYNVDNKENLLSDFTRSAVEAALQIVK